MKNHSISLLLLLPIFFIGCSLNKTKAKEQDATAAGQKIDTANKTPVADNQTILSRKEVPVLCYHNILNFRPGESDGMKVYDVSPAAFAEQMKALADSGYQ